MPEVEMLDALRGLKKVVNDILLPKCVGGSEGHAAIQEIQCVDAFAKAENAISKAEAK